MTRWPQTWISLNMENSEFSGNSVQPHRKIVTNKVFLVCHSNICVKQLLICYIAGVDVEWRSLLRLLFVAITYGKVSLWLLKSLENSGNFFLLLFGHPDWVQYSRCSNVKEHNYFTHVWLHRRSHCLDQADTRVLKQCGTARLTEGSTDPCSQPADVLLLVVYWVMELVCHVSTGMTSTHSFACDVFGTVHYTLCVFFWSTLYIVRVLLNGQNERLKKSSYPIAKTAGASVLFCVLLVLSFNFIPLRQVHSLICCVIVYSLPVHSRLWSACIQCQYIHVSLWNGPLWVLEHSCSCCCSNPNEGTLLCISVYAVWVDVLMHAVDLHKTASR